MAKKAETAANEAVEATVAAETETATLGGDTEATKAPETPKEELVEVELFKDNKDYKDDVFVCINGRNKVIKRGKKVKIPKAYAKVLEQSMKQDRRTADLMDKKADEFSAESASRNI